MRLQVELAYTSLVVVISLLVCIVFIGQAYSSPPFVRQEIIDEYDDGWDHSSKRIVEGKNFVDFGAVSYASDGRYLNATFFLNSQAWHGGSNFTAYGMLIDVDSDLNSGWQGYDYMMRVSWDNLNRNWTYLVQEWSSISLARNVLEEPGFTGIHSENENKTVHISLDLDDVSSPSQYIVVFFTDYDFQENDHYSEISDYSNSVYIPPPRFTITALPSSLALRPGEEKTVEVRVNSSSGVFNPRIELSTNNIDTLESDFNPIGRDIPPIGFVTSHLSVKALEQASAAPYTLQILGNVSFPIQYTGTNETTADLKILSDNILESSDLAVTILEPLTPSERFEEFWSVYGGLLSLILGGFGAGFAALLIEKIRTSRKVLVK